MADPGTFSTAAEAVSKATCSAFKNILENKQKTVNIFGLYFIFGFKVQWVVLATLHIKSRSGSCNEI
jgi:hypothetical protein